MARREDIDIEQFRTKPVVPRTVPQDVGYAAGLRPAKPANPNEDFRLSCLAMRFGGQYYVPVSKFGSQLYDPLADFQTYAKYEYRKVEEAVFNAYLKFLETDNRSYLNQARRAM